MTTIPITEFHVECLALIDQVAQTGETIFVTKNGKPIAELSACKPQQVRSPFGLHKGQSKILGDIVEPLDTSSWDAVNEEIEFDPPRITGALAKPIDLD